MNSLFPRLVRDVVGDEGEDALVPELPHVHLQGEESEDHEAEDGEGHDLGQLSERVKQGVDDGLKSCNERTIC